MSFLFFRKFEKFWFILLDFFFSQKERKKKKKKIFFFGGWLSQFNLAPNFFFFFSFLLFSFPPLTVFILPFHLHFLLHSTISSLKKHFSKLFNFPSLIPFNIFLDPCVFGHFCYIPIFVKPISNLLFSLHKNVILFQWAFFSYFSWEEISSITWMEWRRGAPSRPQNLCSTF